MLTVLVLIACSVYINSVNSNSMFSVLTVLVLIACSVYVNIVSSNSMFSVY